MRQEQGLAVRRARRFAHPKGFHNARYTMQYAPTSPFSYGGRRRLDPVSHAADHVLAAQDVGVLECDDAVRQVRRHVEARTGANLLFLVAERDPQPALEHDHDLLMRMLVGVGTLAALEAQQPDLDRLTGRKRAVGSGVLRRDVLLLDVLVVDEWHGCSLVDP